MAETESNEAPAAEANAENGRAGTEQEETQSEDAIATEYGDEPGYVITATDRLLDKYYGDHMHANPGNHLTGGVDKAVDERWQKYMDRLVRLPPSMMDLPKNCKAGSDFCQTWRRYTVAYVAETGTPKCSSFSHLSPCNAAPMSPASAVADASS